MNISNLINRGKSVPNLTAQSTKLCATHSSVLNEHYEKLEKIKSTPGINIKEKIIYHLLIMHGLRISNILQIHSKTLSPLGTLYIQQSKGSAPVIINDDYTKSFFLAFYNTNCYIFSEYSRFYFYRQLRKYGMYHKFENNFNTSVTHLGRHLYNLQFKEVEKNLDININALGHKNTNNKKYYDKKI